MSIKIHSETVTANQFAKWVVYQQGCERAYYWRELESEAYANMTPREVESVNSAIDKQVSRVSDFLRIDKVFETIWD